jgi:hypothetical protein
MLEVDATGRHAGDHRTHQTIARVGKVKISWKNHAKKRRDEMTVTYSEGPPVVQLREDAAQNPYLTGQARKVKCECPDWWVGHGHRAPCRLSMDSR